MSKTKTTGKTKRPCVVCRRWYEASARARHRQRCCGAAACRQALRKRTQAEWRGRNREYWSARRFDAAVARAEAAKDAAPVGTPPEAYGRVPWEVAQDVFGIKGAVFIGLFGRVLARTAQDDLRGHVLGMKAEIAGLRAVLAQEEMARKSQLAQGPP